VLDEEKDRVSDDGFASPVDKEIPKSRERRTETVGTKVTPEEERELQRAAHGQGKKMAEWVRDVLLSHARQTFSSLSQEPIMLTEVVGIQLFLMNVLSPLTRGELISAEEYQAMIRSVQANKGRTTRELLARRRNEERE
jgi:uncharacterized protein (DUF1778 family)